MTAPPAPFTARPATLEDAAAVAELLNALDDAFLAGSAERVSGGDVRDWWSSEDLERMSLLVHAPAGELAAYSTARVRDDCVSFDSFVAPIYAGHGLGSFLIDHAERLTRQNERELVRIPTLTPDERARCLVESRGFRHVRAFFRMVIDLERPPPDAVWPDDTDVSPLAPGEERTYYEVHEESFQDHWGHEATTFEEWSRQKLEVASADPSIWFLARVGGEPAGAVICAQKFDIGWVEVLGVRRPWRRLGLGSALLRHAFGALYDRGERRVGLAVDAASQTGATRLYEREGMRVAWQADLWEKHV